jgi:cell division protein FtsW
MNEKRDPAQSGYDYGLLIPAMCLLFFGLVMVYSASSPLADHKLGDSYYYLKKQALFCVLGIGLMLLAKRIPCAFYLKMVYPLLGLSYLLLIMLLIPGIGAKIGGAHRWIRLGWLTLQPSELAKFSLVVYLAYSMAKKGSQMASFSQGLLPHLVVAGGFMGLIMLQPDLGTAVIMAGCLLLLLFVGGVRITHLIAIFLAMAPGVIWMILRADYRLKRWLAFINPWEDPKGIGFQIINSFLAFGAGGPFGVGLGNGKQKLFYLPEPHTDFVFAIAAEELGLVGTAAIIVLFGILIARGVKVALNAKDLYSTYLAFGLTSLIGLQVVVNLGVVTGLLPTKGLTLPFISYGGSSLIVNLLCVGILLSISARK